jgi:Fe-S-cluster-containing dehydrogenase component
MFSIHISLASREKLIFDDGGEHMAKKKTRREFFKDAGLAIGGVAAGSIALTSPRRAEAQINIRPVSPAKGVLMHEESICLGCRTCEGVCSMHHYGVASPKLTRIKVVKDWRKRNKMDVDFDTQACMQCTEPLCLQACPVGAIKMDEKSGTNARVVDQSLCVAGCHICEQACPYTPSRVFRNAENKAAICDLCEGEVPCVKYCPSGALTYQYDPKGIGWTGYPTQKADAKKKAKKEVIRLAKGGN